MSTSQTMCGLYLYLVCWLGARLMKEKTKASPVRAFVAATSQYWLFAQPAIPMTFQVIFELQVMPILASHRTGHQTHHLTGYQTHTYVEGRAI